jgi:hypothetical protein
MRHGRKTTTDSDGDGYSGSIIRSAAGPGVIVGQKQYRASPARKM